MSKIWYCPVCGGINPNNNKCIHCDTEIQPIQSKYDEEYYFDKGMQIFGFSFNNYYSILKDEEIIHNSNYNPDISKSVQKYYYCSVCGHIYENYVDSCHNCIATIPIKKSLHNKDYYVNKFNKNPQNYDEDIIELLAGEIIDDNFSDGFIPLFQEEIINNPNFNKSLYSSSISQSTTTNQQQYTPKCPVCQSPNINKISEFSRAIHGLTFGLFSKTARSQWVCNNCGNKW